MDKTKIAVHECKSFYSPVIYLYGSAVLILTTVMLAASCMIPKQVSDKSGAQLWGENCNRCHNSPTVEQYKPAQWDIIVTTHMKREAGLTDSEVKKMVNFLKQGKYPW